VLIHRDTIHYIYVHPTADVAYSQLKVPHRSRIRYLSKKWRILTNFPKLKKNRKIRTKVVKCPSVGLNLRRFMVSS